MMYNNPEVLHALLDHLTEALIAYCGYQIEAGAQVRATRPLPRRSPACHARSDQAARHALGHVVRLPPPVAKRCPHPGSAPPALPPTPRPLPPQVIQLFDSWAHHLSPEQFAEFSMPYAERIIAAVRAQYPHVPIIFHANGGSGKHAQLAQCTAGGQAWAPCQAGCAAGHARAAGR